MAPNCLGKTGCGPWGLLRLPRAGGSGCVLPQSSLSPRVPTSPCTLLSWNSSVNLYSWMFPHQLQASRATCGMALGLPRGPLAAVFPALLLCCSHFRDLLCCFIHRVGTWKLLENLWCQGLVTGRELAARRASSPKLWFLNLIQEEFWLRSWWTPWRMPGCRSVSPQHRSLGHAVGMD